MCAQNIKVGSIAIILNDKTQRVRCSKVEAIENEGFDYLLRWWDYEVCGINLYHPRRNSRQLPVLLDWKQQKYGLSHTEPQILKEILKDFYTVYLWNLKAKSNINLRSWIALADRGDIIWQHWKHKVTHEIVAKECLWIIILLDTCHLLNNTAKDIGKLEFFPEVCCS